MTIKKNILPNIAHNEVDLILISEWIGEESDLKKSTNVSMNEVEASEWPDGLISYSCFLSNDKQKVLHCAQWKSQHHHLHYVENYLPERLEKLKGKIAVKAEKSFGRFKMKESSLDETEFTPEYIYFSLNSNTSELKNNSENLSEYLLRNIDNGSLLNYVELKGVDDKILSTSETSIYSLFRSYVHI